MNTKAGIGSIKLLDLVEEIFCGMGLLAITVLLFINVILRYFFSAGLPWSEEVIRYVMIWITFIGGSMCVRIGAHVSIDFFIPYLRPNMRRYLFIGVNLVGLGFSLALVVFGIQFITWQYGTGQITPTLEIPMYIPYLSIPIGFGLSALRFGQVTMTYIKKSRGE